MKKLFLTIYLILAMVGMASGTVTSSEVVEDHAQTDGLRFIAFKFTFHTSEIVIKRFRADSSYNTTTGLSEMETVVESEMIDREIDQMIAGVEQGSVNQVTDIPVHPETDSASVRQKRFLRKLVRWAMKTDEIKLAYALCYPIWYEFKFNQSYTATQIQNILDLTVAQYNKINDRLTAFHNDKTLIDNDDSYVGDLDE